MIKNIIFDIGNVILNFEVEKVLSKYTSNEEDRKFILDNIINSPEWLGYSLIDTGYVTKEEAISIVQDRTNHIKDELIYNFWNTYNDYAFVDERVLDLIKNLKQKYKIYLLSNINQHTIDAIKGSGLFELVDGYVLSYLEHQIKPYNAIYNTLLNRYNIKAEESIFIDDNIRNINAANLLGFKALKVESDNYDSIIEALSNNIN